MIQTKDNKPIASLNILFVKYLIFTIRFSTFISNILIDVKEKILFAFLNEQIENSLLGLTSIRM